MHFALLISFDSSRANIGVWIGGGGGDPHGTCRIKEMVMSHVLVTNKSLYPLLILRNGHVACHYNI